MGNIVGLDGKPIDPLTVIIRGALEENGSVSQNLDELAVNVQKWRQAARAVARDLGRPVQTVVSADAVHAVLRDWPADERERQIHEQAMRDAMDSVALSNEVLVPIVPCPGCGSAREWHPGVRLVRAGSVSCPHCGLVEVGNP